MWHLRKMLGVLDVGLSMRLTSTMAGGTPSGEDVPLRPLGDVALRLDYKNMVQNTLIRVGSQLTQGDLSAINLSATSSKLICGDQDISLSKAGPPYSNLPPAPLD